MTDSLRLAWRTFHLPKEGNTIGEYEDAFAGDAARGRFAIADGASESAFADVWANVLVCGYVQTPGAWSSWLADARALWNARVQTRELPWYAENKFTEGAYAALLGVAFTKNGWRAAAVGDCCLFQVRAERLLRAFPMRHSEDFDNRPSLVGSRRRSSAQPRTRRIRWRGDFLPGDVIYLMTDALAQWFLKETEAGRAPWQQLAALADREAFAARINEWRQAKELRNDDVTVMLIEAQDA